ncbi:hypothetical protein C0992_002338 [Termitomyces sp. T32_za158]|nr:hypothetical protein C0992_002338 [Termitomyces sp. T32_za158]
MLQKATHQRLARVILSPADVPENNVEQEDFDSMSPSFDAAEENELDDVLDGQTSYDLSHAGGEFEHIVADFLRDENNQRSYQKDQRTRRDRTQNRIEAFQLQMGGIIDAYMSWAARMGGSAFKVNPASVQEGPVEGAFKLRVMDVFRMCLFASILQNLINIKSESFSFVPQILETDANVPAVLLRHGLIPTAPLKPSFAFSIRAVELYCITHLRSPHLTIEPFIKSLCDLNRIPFRQYIAQQFTIAFDLYLDIRARVSSHVDAALGRDIPKWRLKNACSACTYKLRDESDLTFKMLFTMDGNNSLKRLRCASKSPPTEEGSEPCLGQSKARQDTRTVPGDRYLTREEVDDWAKATLEDLLPTDGGKTSSDDEDNPCVGRWKNMINEVTAKMWSIFDETGVFLALCRHGFSLVIADMVESGELSKYPIAVVSKLLNVFGEDLGGGYDIGCKFKTTIDNSTLGAQAHELRFKALVGSFHGHAHNRICQLSNLAAYVKGMGLEDLEGCERFFSKSNALAISVRYASVFHRRQKISEYMEHTDAFETQHNLSTFLINNYRQALDLLAGEDVLWKTMEDQGITGTEVFHQWLEEERVYLTSLSKEPIQETLEMNYYQKLVDFYAASQKLTELKKMWHVFNPHAPAADPKPPGTKRQYKPDTKVRHAQEALDNALRTVQDLELQMEIVERWTPDCDAWKAAALLVGRRRYQRCLDELESLIVSRMFELSKMNMSQTGYKLRKHIGKALKARSQAIRSALKRYNKAAALLSPPRPPLAWDQVVEYAFLADFDLLRDCRQDVRERPWARPAARLAMDRYFKMERAREEIQRLNIEIKRVVTHMRDEEAFLLSKEEGLRNTDAALAFQVQCYREERTRFYEVHRRRFKKLASNPRFTGSIIPGIPLDQSLLQDLLAPMHVDDPHATLNQRNNHDDDDSDEEDDDEATETEIVEALEVIAS